MYNNQNLPATERDILDLFFSTMRNVEVDSIRKYFEHMPDCINPETGESWSPGPYIKMANAIQNIFTLLVNSRLGGKTANTLEAFETFVGMRTPTFLSFVVKLNLGAECIPFDLSAAGGTWDRLPYNIGKLSNLRYLYLNGQPIEDLSPLAPLELNFVCLEACRVTDVSPLNLKRLGWCNLRETPIRDLTHLINHGNSLGIIPLQDTLVDDMEQILSLTKLSACSDIWLEGTKVFEKLPQQFDFFHKEYTSTRKRFLLFDEHEHDRRKGNMVRPTHYMDMDALDFVKNLPEPLP